VLKKMSAYLAWGVAFFVAMCATISTILSNFSTGILLAYALAIVLGSWGGLLYFTKYNRLNKVIAILLGLLIIICAVMGVYGAYNNASYSEDAIIVLGAGINGEEIGEALRLRLECAIDYHRKNPEAIIVVSGGQGPEEDISEAMAMERYLISNGVSPEIIIKEELSTSTRENLEYSKKILDGIFEDNCEIAVITSRFHIYRATVIAKKAGYGKVTHIGAGIPWYTAPSNYLRECAAIMLEYLSITQNG